LSLGEDSGKLGLQISVRFFFGWQFIIGAGRQIDLKREGCLILSNAPYVIRRMRQYNTC